MERLDKQLHSVQMSQVRLSVWEALHKASHFFHIYPGADTDVTKDKQPGQKSREICWENQGVPSKESLPRCPSISSSIKCPSGSTL